MSAKAENRRGLASPGVSPVLSSNKGRLIGAKSLCLLLLIVVLCAHQGQRFSQDRQRATQDETTTGSDYRCEQYAALQPNSSAQVLEVFNAIGGEDYRRTSANLLAGAVKIATVSYDDMGSVGDDTRWEIFADLALYYKRSFPRVHAQLELTIVNTYGLLYTWPGTDMSLKPVVLMAHSDVVPADSVDQWTYPPFSGHIDSDTTYVYGRGASDCKNVEVGLLESVEALISANFTPARTTILSFGFDEEISGDEGGLKLAQHLESIYGANGIAIIVDEGAGFSELYGQVFATPGIAEKGYLDATITVNMPGGHSSVPPDHTAIGILSQILVAIEQHPYGVKLERQNPLYQSMVCASEYAPNFPRDLGYLLKHGNLKKLAAALRHDLGSRYLMATSIAETIIRGGVKVNALPESASAVVNHRIAIHEDSRIVQEKLAKIARTVAQEHGLTLQAFDGLASKQSSVHLSAGLDTLDPAPITPTDTAEYKLLAGTIRSVFPEVLVAPGMSSGNTDTKSYWNLTKHIFRFEPSLHGSMEGDETNIHTINEKMSVTGHVELVKFFYQFIQNVQVEF